MSEHFKELANGLIDRALSFHEPSVYPHLDADIYAFRAHVGELYRDCLITTLQRRPSSSGQRYLIRHMTTMLPFLRDADGNEIIFCNLCFACECYSLARHDRAEYVELLQVLMS
jgi:hypothetical protein